MSALTRPVYFDDKYSNGNTLKLLSTTDQQRTILTFSFFLIETSYLMLRKDIFSFSFLKNKTSKYTIIKKGRRALTPPLNIREGKAQK